MATTLKKRYKNTKNGVIDALKSLEFPKKNFVKVLRTCF